MDRDEGQTTFKKGLLMVTTGLSVTGVYEEDKYSVEAFPLGQKATLFQTEVAVLFQIPMTKEIKKDREGNPHLLPARDQRQSKNVEMH